MSDIQIRPQPRFLGRQDEQYAFAYEITIINQGNRAARLLNRHWIITHGNGFVEEVKGEGVVGEQPRLEPGQSFVYTSGALIPTSTGSMAGSYEFEFHNGARFRVTIPEFVLAAPESLH